MKQSRPESANVRRRRAARRFVVGMTVVAFASVGCGDDAGPIPADQISAEDLEKEVGSECDPTTPGYNFDAYRNGDCMLAACDIGTDWYNQEVVDEGICPDLNDDDDEPVDDEPTTTAVESTDAPTTTVEESDDTETQDDSTVPATTSKPVTRTVPSTTTAPTTTMAPTTSSTSSAPPTTKKPVGATTTLPRVGGTSTLP